MKDTVVVRKRATGYGNKLRRETENVEYSNAVKFIKKQIERDSSSRKYLTMVNKNHPDIKDVK